MSFPNIQTPYLRQPPAARREKCQGAFRSQSVAWSKKAFPGRQGTVTAHCRPSAPQIRRCVGGAQRLWPARDGGLRIRRFRPIFGRALQFNAETISLSLHIPVPLGRLDGSRAAPPAFHTVAGGAHPGWGDYGYRMCNAGPCPRQGACVARWIRVALVVQALRYTNDQRFDVGGMAPVPAERS